MSPLVSVIIPLYNTEIYLEKCLNSLIGQSLQDIEIICVDDCSPDRSAEIVSDLASTDKRISLIRHEKNLGQGGARNTGVRAASANYVASVDGDDWIDTEMMDTLYNATQGEKVDIVCCGWKLVDESGAVISRQGRKPAAHNNSDNSVNIFEVLNPALWNKLIRKSLITKNQIEFPHYLCFEDLATTPRLVSKADSVTVIEDRLYNYLSRENSQLASYSSKQVYDYFEAFSILQNFLIENNLFDHYFSEFCGMIQKHLSYYSRRVMSSNLEDEPKLNLLKCLYSLKSEYLQGVGILDRISIDDIFNLCVSDLPGKKSLAGMTR